jgi:phospholipid/cholesterol/gamma-HCH transport system ATP-binding protein
LKVAAIAVTHDMRSAFKIADRSAMLHAGRIIFDGTVEQTRDTDNPIVRQFIEGATEGPLTTY